MARRDRRRREAGAFAVSVLVHLVLLVVLARVAVPAMYQPPTTPSPAFQLQLVNTPPAPSAAPAPRASRHAIARPLPAPAATRAPVAPQRTPQSPARAIQAAPRPAPPKAPQAPPAPPSRASASVPAAGASNGAPNATGATGGGNRWRVNGEDDGQDGVRKFLRATVGCSHEEYVRLTTVERADCDRRMGAEARTIGIPPDRLAVFIAEAQAQERARAARTGPLGQPVTPCPGATNFSVSCLTPKPHN